MPSKGGVFHFKIRAKRQQILQLVLKKEAAFIFRERLKESPAMTKA